MTEAQKHENLVKHVKILCQLLNEHGIKDKVRDDEYDWQVDEETPVATFGGGICGNREAFHFLKRRGELDKNVCWECGEQPINSQYTFTDGSDSSIEYSICEKCYLKGKKFHQALRGNSSSTCFIATVCYHDQNAIQIKVLRHFRDTVLLNNLCGFQCVKLYYSISPAVAKWLSNKPLLVKFTRKFILNQFVRKLTKKYKYFERSS